MSNSGMVRFANFIRGQLRENWDWWTVIEGPEGVGKSNLAIWFAHYVSGPLFQLDQHICYEPSEFMELVDATPRYGTILLDEAAELWYNRDFAAKTNKALAKASTQIRDRNLNIILCLPDILMLDKAGIRRHKTYVQVQAPGGIRGKSLWHKPVWRRYGGTKNLPYWDLKFIDFFPQLPENIERDYVRVKTERSLERMQEYISAADGNKKGGDTEPKVDFKGLADQIMRGDYPDVFGSRTNKPTQAKVAAAFDITDHYARRVIAEYDKLIKQP